jgi:AraC-like DNA-binding protein
MRAPHTSIVMADRDHGAEPALDASGAYREFAPPPHLRDYVLCFWRRTASAAPASRPILPDGCIDIIWRNAQPPFVVGPMTLPVLSSMTPGTEFVGIRFRPGVAHQMLGVSAKALLDQDAPLRAIWPRQWFEPWEAVTASGPTAATLEAIAAAVQHRLRTISPPDPFVSAAAAWIAAHPCDRLDRLARLSGLSERQMRRRFDQAIGYGPKTLQRVLRLQYLLWLASQQRAAGARLAQLALAAGYADQPHMTREVLALTGTSPLQLLLESAPQSAVSGLFQSAIGCQLSTIGQ